MADLGKRMQEYASQQGVSVDELRQRLDLEMQQRGGPTFEEGIQKVCYIIDTPQKTTYHRAKDILKVDTDFLKPEEASEEIDNALKRANLRPEVLAVMEVAVKVDKLKMRTRRKKDEAPDPLFKIFHDARTRED